MPRKAREKSSTGIYHVMLRGINQQQIFADDEDYKNMLQIIREYKESTGIDLYAYCLMGNHIHLLIKENEIGIDQFIKRVGTKFVYWYNLKYKRTGHLFQDRFKSEAVENDEYFITVIRYIHQNPKKAGIVRNIADYPYSSYKEYIDAVKTGSTDLVDSEFVFGVIPQEKFAEVNEAETNEVCLDIDITAHIRVTDQQALGIIQKITKCKNATEFQMIDPQKQQICIKKLHEKGLSVRQISRLCGVSKGYVERSVR